MYKRKIKRKLKTPPNMCAAETEKFRLSCVIQGAPH